MRDQVDTAFRFLVEAHGYEHVNTSVEGVGAVATFRSSRLWITATRDRSWLHADVAVVGAHHMPVTETELGCLLDVSGKILDGDVVLPEFRAASADTFLRDRIAEIEALFTAERLGDTLDRLQRLRENTRRQRREQARVRGAARRAKQR